MRYTRSLEFLGVSAAPGHSGSWPNSYDQSRETKYGATEYSVREVGAGSGGSEYEFTASVPVPNRRVYLMARMQSEWGPNFQFAWEIIDSIP